MRRSRARARDSRRSGSADATARTVQTERARQPRIDSEAWNGIGCWPLDTGPLAMTTAALDLARKTHAYDVIDMEYLRHGDKPLLASVYVPRGDGPFPALVECHGGAWCLSDRTREKLRYEYMAARGIVSVALDFRSGNADPYPA